MVPPAAIHSVMLCSRAGKQLFGEALAAGGMQGFFPLIEQFRCAFARAAAHCACPRKLAFENQDLKARQCIQKRATH